MRCYFLGSHRVCCTLVFNFALFSNFLFACFASQTSGLCSAFPSAPVKSVTRFCYALVRTLFCVFCHTNTGFVQCYSLGCRKVCCTLVFNFPLFSNFCFACFASQTSGLCSAFPSAPVKSITRFCYTLVRTLFCVFCLKNTGFVQFYSLGSSSLLHACVYFALFINFFAQCVLPHELRSC